MTDDLVARLRDSSSVLRPLRYITSLDDHELLRVGPNQTPTRVVWLSIGWSTLTTIGYCRIREAITVMDLLASLDRSVWLQQLNEFMEQEKRVRRLCDDDEAMPCVLGIELVLFSITAPMITPLVMSASSYEPSAEYRAAVAGYEAQVGSEGIPMKISLRGMGEAYHGEVLLTMLQYLAMQQAVREQPGLVMLNSYAVPVKDFKMHRMDPDSAALTHSSLQYLHQFVLAGVEVLEIKVLSLHDYAAHERQSAQALRALFPTQGAGVSRVHISDEMIPKEQISMLMSLVLDCPSVSSLRLYMSLRSLSPDSKHFEHRENFLKWFACVLFSSEANHNIEFLEIDTQCLRMPDVEFLRRFLTDSPHADLIAGAMGIAPRPVGNRLVTADKFFLTHPDSPDFDAEYDAPFKTSTPVNVQLLHPLDPDETHAKVLLPGAGVAWVRCDTMKIVSASEVNAKAATKKPITRLQLNDMRTVTKQVVSAMLTLIGSTIKELTLHSNHNYTISVLDAMDDWCRDGLTSCPQLETLDLGNAPLNNLRVFIQNENCRLRKLTLGCKLQFTENGVVDFFNILADPTHSLTLHMAELSLNVVMTAENCEPLLRCFSHMLNCNRRLHTVRLFLHQNDSSWDITKEQEDVLLDHMYETVTVRASPLSLRNKLAFISALQRRASNSVARLDASAVGNIFGFAAEGRTRFVRPLIYS